MRSDVMSTILTEKNFYSKMDCMCQKWCHYFRMIRVIVQSCDLHVKLSKNTVYYTFYYAYCARVNLICGIWYTELSRFLRTVYSIQWTAYNTHWYGYNGEVDLLCIHSYILDLTCSHSLGSNLKIQAIATAIPNGIIFSKYVNICEFEYKC